MMMMMMMMIMIIIIIIREVKHYVSGNRPNSVNKHFIIWPPRFSFFFLGGGGKKIQNVAHFDRKVWIYIATKLF